MNYKINRLELFVYYSVWISVITFSLCKFYEAQNEICRSNPYWMRTLSDLTPGWTFLGREKDNSDVEWSSWKYFIQTSWLYLVIQCLISEAIRQLDIPVHKYWYIVSSVVYILFYMGVKHLMIILLQPVIFFLLIICGGKHFCIWITSLLLLLTYNSIKYRYYFWQYMNDNSHDEKIFLLLFAIGWIELRCISFCSDYVEKLKKNKSEGKGPQENVFQVFLNMMSYILYLPLLYLGPIMLYEDFENSFQYKSEKLWQRLKRFAVDIFLFQLYTFLLDLALHYIYFCAMHSNMEIINKLPTLALSGGGLWMGFHFHAKYVISYGTTSAFARLDNMDPPPTPRCIARIHVYSLMWRYFDVGLYKFLVKYIYKPGYSMLSQYINISKIMYKLLASLCTFIFIFLWHGIALNIFIWSLLNYCGILLEDMAKALSKTLWYKHFKENVLKTDAMEVRFIAALCAPLLAVSAISNFYLFGGTEVGHTYIGLLNWPAPHNLMIVLISTYCCCHVSMTLLNVPSRTDVKINRIRVKGK